MATSKKIDLPSPPEGPDRPVVLARVYPGYHEHATELFQMDAEMLALHGYLPHGQSYAEGRWAQWLIVVATILVLIVIGGVLLVYMAVTRPPGTLSATYLRTDAVLHTTR
jgi:hypothetical protein